MEGTFENVTRQLISSLIIPVSRSISHLLYLQACFRIDIVHADPPRIRDLCSRVSAVMPPQLRCGRYWERPSGSHGTRKSLGCPGAQSAAENSRAICDDASPLQEALAPR